MTEISSSSQTIEFAYDTDPFGSGSYPKGRLSTVKYGSTSDDSGEFTEMYAYNEAGFVTKKRLRLKRSYQGYYPTGDMDAEYTYDNEGRMTSYKVPVTGDTFNYTFDMQGMPRVLTKTGLSDPYVKKALYGPAGELTSFEYMGVYPNYITETRDYNPLLQLTGITVEDEVELEYTYSATQNTGRITKRKDWISGEEISYQYDSLQRLISAQTTGPEWGNPGGNPGTQETFPRLRIRRSRGLGAPGRFRGVFVRRTPQPGQIQDFNTEASPQPSPSATSSSALFTVTAGLEG